MRGRLLKLTTAKQAVVDKPKQTIINTRLNWDNLSYDRREELINAVRENNINKLEDFKDEDLNLYYGHLLNETEDANTKQYIKNRLKIQEKDEEIQKISLMGINYQRNPHLRYVARGQICEKKEKGKIEIKEKLNPLISQDNTVAFKELRDIKMPEYGIKQEVNPLEDNEKIKNILPMVDFIRKLYSTGIDIFIVISGVNISGEVIAKAFKESKIYLYDESLKIPVENDNYIETNVDPIDKIQKDYLLIVNINDQNVKDTTEEKQKKSLENMEKQKGIVDKYVNRKKPIGILSKFNLPWSSLKSVDGGNINELSYYNGVFTAIPGVSLRSTECKLISLPPYSEKNYNFNTYAESIAYYNQCIRSMYFKYDYDIKVLDHCAACKQIAEITKEYLNFNGVVADNVSINNTYTNWYA